MTRRRTPNRRVGALVRAAREKTGLSQREVAARSGGALSPAFVSRIEAGDRNMGVETIAALSRTLPVSLRVYDGGAWITVDGETVSLVRWNGQPDEGGTE